MNERGQALAITGIMLGLVALVVLTFAGVYAFRWYYAEPKGQLEAREEILSGDTRIAAYNHFFNLCASVQANEVALDAQDAQLEQTTDEDDRDRIRTNISGLTAVRGSGIAQYNADAEKDYTIGQFRDLDLPYQLDTAPYDGENRTRC